MRPAGPGLDDFVAGLDYPVFVVTAASGDERDGCLVGFSTQTSIDPPRLLVCLSKANRTTRIARTSQVRSRVASSSTGLRWARPWASRATRCS